MGRTVSHRGQCKAKHRGLGLGFDVWGRSLKANVEPGSREGDGPCWPRDFRSLPVLRVAIPNEGRRGPVETVRVERDAILGFDSGESQEKAAGEGEERIDPLAG